MRFYFTVSKYFFVVFYVYDFDELHALQVFLGAYMFETSDTAMRSDRQHPSKRYLSKAVPAAATLIVNQESALRAHLFGNELSGDPP